MAAIYCVLVVGAITTLFPFLVMISTGIKSTSDQSDQRLVPGYLRTEPELVEKYLNDKYTENKSAIAATRFRRNADASSVDRYEQFLLQLEPDRWTAMFRMPSTQVVGKLNARYREWLRARFKSIDALNRAYIEENVAFQTVLPPAELFERKKWSPPSGQKWQDWLTFKRTLPAEFRDPVRTTAMYQQFLASKYRNQIHDVPKEVLGTSKAFEEIALREGPDYQQFVRDSLPDHFRQQSVESQWKEAGGDGPLPIAAFESVYVAKHSSELRREYMGRNFGYVVDYVLLHGRAVANTVIFCFLAILTQLTVNPLAAYALSRYPIRATGKILLFLLATMAFPAEVAMIPSFLLLKDLGLLNTFAALVLPGAASGYMIFLLKGFFDSLPAELYEAAGLDGAKETTMMFRIAFPMSRPVLGYLALLAFMGAYGTFIYAFLIAQDEKMWTMMVWVYQLQQTAPKCVMMAALTIAALPTLLVFLVTQKVIMRGIVLPGER